MRALKLFRSVNQHKQIIASSQSSPIAATNQGKTKKEQINSCKNVMPRKQLVQYVPIRISTFPSNHIPETGCSQLVKMIIDGKHKLKPLESEATSIKGALTSNLLESRMLLRHSSLPNSTLTVLPRHMLTPFSPRKHHELRNIRVKSQLSRPLEERSYPTEKRNKNELKQSSLMPTRDLNSILPIIRYTSDFADCEQVTGW